MAESLRKYWTYDSWLHIAPEFCQTSTVTESPIPVIKAADVDAVLAAQADGYVGERTTWTLVPKDGEPIELRPPAPLVRYILELDDHLAAKDAEVERVREAAFLEAIEIVMQSKNVESVLTLLRSKAGGEKLIVALRSKP